MVDMIVGIVVMVLAAVVCIALFVLDETGVL